MSEDNEIRIARLERIVRLLALHHTIKTRSVRYKIKRDLDKELLDYIKGPPR